MKIKTRWLVCVVENKSKSIIDYSAEFDGFLPSAEQLREYCEENDCVILSMQKIKYGKFGLLFRK